LLEGTLYKFKPGLSSNFIERYVQISKRAFRYFKDKRSAIIGKPLVAFRKNIINKVVWYKINKDSYLKQGAKVSKSTLEHELFENVFEVQLKEDYEDHYEYKDYERKFQDSKIVDRFDSNNSLISRLSRNSIY